MNAKRQAPPISREFEELNLQLRPHSGTEDDDDDRDDEHDGENEVPIREIDENTETPEEFEVDDEDEFGHDESEHSDDASGKYDDDLPD